MTIQKEDCVPYLQGVSNKIQLTNSDTRTDPILANIKAVP